MNSVSFDVALKQGGCRSKIFNLEPIGQVRLEAHNQLSSLADKDRVINVYGQDVQESLVVDGEDTRVHQRLLEAARDRPRREESVPCSWSFVDSIKALRRWHTCRSPLAGFMKCTSGCIVKISDAMTALRNVVTTSICSIWMLCIGDNTQGDWDEVDTNGTCLCSCRTAIKWSTVLE